MLVMAFMAGSSWRPRFAAGHIDLDRGPAHDGRQAELRAAADAERARRLPGQSLNAQPGIDEFVDAEVEEREAGAEERDAEAGSDRSGCSFGKLCSIASTMPGAEIEPVTKAIPTGSKGLGGRDLVASPAQKLWRSPATVAKPVIPLARTKS